ncbi:hypothetical protein Sjap_016802 [Stephania japonica]|uniref:non-specific serine/threonine protein kinase n=1 Tax=Stephania japonica TaxID=461633 RepID=A0AAP0NHQ5_9MAGN
MALQFRDQNDEIGVRIKVVSADGAVAAESKMVGAKWVILDKNLKVEEKHCIDNLHCNIVVMRHSQPKVLRLNLVDSDETQQPCSSSALGCGVQKSQENKLKHSTPVSSPEDPTISFTRTTGGGSASSSDGSSSPFILCEHNPLFERNKMSPRLAAFKQVHLDYYDMSSDSDPRLMPNGAASPRTCIQNNVYWIHQNHTTHKHSSLIRSYGNNHNPKPPTSRPLIERLVHVDQEDRIQTLGFSQRSQRGHVFNSDVRDAVSLGRSSSAPPPLCSICQHKAPVFGKPPRWFNYRELKEATDGFSEEYLLAEGRFGSVHRGLLRDGQMVAVKQLKIAVARENNEFSKEVGVLGCAQHRNVVMLIGFCTEGRKRILVYEYVCNGSLDFHLYGENAALLDWHSRLKIAIGVARGLRYLHEDCRVGCIVHKDLHPNNILLTHDFEPLVGDFGINRWQPELYFETEQSMTRISRYLAPEYAFGGHITQKADVYAFGVILLELITSLKAVDITRSHGKQLLHECLFALVDLEEQSQVQALKHQFSCLCMDLVQSQNFQYQLEAMAQAAAICLRRDPDTRPPMSKVLRILEGGDATIPLALDTGPIGNRSARMVGLSSNKHTASKANHNRRLSH